MTATETQLPEVTELERVEAWRSEELERAGYDQAAAAEIAHRHEVDLHRAIALLEQGCSAELALSILL